MSLRFTTDTRVAVIGGLAFGGLILALIYCAEIYNLRHSDPAQPQEVRFYEKRTTVQPPREEWIRISKDYATAPILDASGGADGAAIYFVGNNEAGYTILRDVTQAPDSQIGYVYVDPKTKGVIVQIGNVRVGVR